MPTEKKAAIAKEAKKSVKEYKVIGESFKRKTEADKTLKKIFDKGFKGAGLMVRKNEFVILFGTYQTERAARENATAVQQAGFAVEIADM